MGNKRRKPSSPQRREANGRLSRRTDDIAARQLKGVQTLNEEQRKMLLPGISARIRIHDVRPEDARDQFAGSFVGRLFLRGEITRAQLEASQIYLMECVNNSKACASPRMPGAVDLNATRGRSSDLEDVEFNQKSIAAYKASRAAVMDKQIEVRGSANLFAALSLCVVEDRPLTNLIGDLRYATSALAKHYKLERRIAA